MSRLSLCVLCVAPSVFGGCSASRLSAREAELTFDAINDVANVLVTSARDAVEKGKTAGLDIESKGANFEISGRLDDAGAFAGSVSVSGTAKQDGNDFSYELVASFDGVEVDGTVLDGELSLVFFAEDVGDIDLNFAVGSSLDGTLQVSGEAEGTAVIEYDLEFRLDGLDVTMIAEGNISGHDVSGWDDVTISL